MKKERPQKKQCYPGGHIEVWHKSSEVIQPKETCGTSVQANATEHQLAQHQQLQPPIYLTPGIDLSTTQEIPGAAIAPVYSGRPLCEADYSEQWSHEPVISQDPVYQSSTSVTDLSLSTCNSTLSTNSSSTSYDNWANICSETLFSPETWINGREARALPETENFKGPQQIEGFDSYNFLSQTFGDPISCVSGFAYPDFCYFPWTAPNDLTMGGGEHFPTPQLEQTAFPESGLVPSPEGCEQLSIHGPWPTQVPGSTLMPNCLIPAPPSSQDTLNDCTSPSQPLEENGLCHNEAPHVDQMSHKQLLVLSPRHSPQNPQPDPAGAEEEEILTVSEDSQDTGEECTCVTESPNTCSSCINSPQSWVMVTYKLVKPAGKGGPEKKPPKPRKRLEEDARRQTSQTRDVGACVRCKIQRIRVFRTSPIHTQGNRG